MMTAVILVNYNGWKDTLDCLDSHRAVTGPEHLIVVVDNGSADGSAEQIVRWAERNGWPLERTGSGKTPVPTRARMVLIETGDNLGFSGGNNAGIRCALSRGADTVVLLNNDTVVSPDYLSRLLEAFQDPDVGIAGGKILYNDRPDRLWLAGGGAIFLPTADTFHPSMNRPDGPRVSRSRDIGYCTGCLLAVRREVIDRIGLLDEKFFLYYEDCDYSLRARRAGYRIRYQPLSVIRHKVSATVRGGRHSAGVLYYHTRNKLYFSIKHSRGILRLLSPWAVRLYDLVKRTVMRIAGRRDDALIMLRAVRDALSGRMGPGA